MMSLLATAFLLASAGGAFAATATTYTITTPWVDFRGHLAPSLGILDTYQYTPLAKTANEAVDKGYVAPPEENNDACADAGHSLTTLCPVEDPSLCLLFDAKGNIAGMEWGVVKFNAASAYPFSKKPYFVSKTRFGLDSWIFTVYLVEQSVINEGGRNTTTPTGSGAWVQSGFNNVITIPRFEGQVAGTPWIKQSCSAGTGMIYQYAMNTTLPCTDIFPLSIYYAAGQLHGFAFQAFGTNTPVASKYMESISAANMKSWTPTAPACLATFMNYGLVSFHTYFTANPWFIPC